MKPGGTFECDNCAGVRFRLVEENGREALRTVHLVSCPFCESAVLVDEGTPAGTRIRHRGAEFVLTEAFGAYALEPADGQTPGCALERG